MKEPVVLVIKRGRGIEMNLNLQIHRFRETISPALVQVSWENEHAGGQRGEKSDTEYAFICICANFAKLYNKAPLQWINEPSFTHATALKLIGQTMCNVEIGRSFPNCQFCGHF